MAITIKLEKSKRSVGFLTLLGFLFALCAMAMILKTAFDAYQENMHANWPRAVATITQQGIRKLMNGRHEAWRIESEVRYTIDGKELTSDIHSGIGSSSEQRSMQSWASQHPPGTSLLVRYDPQHHNAVVPDTAAEMPESVPQVPDDLKASLLFSILSMTLIVIGRRLELRQPKPV